MARHRRGRERGTSEANGYSVGGKRPSSADNTTSAASTPQAKKRKVPGEDTTSLQDENSRENDCNGAGDQDDDGIDVITIEADGAPEEDCESMHESDNATSRAAILPSTDLTLLADDAHRSPENGAPALVTTDTVDAEADPLGLMEGFGSWNSPSEMNHHSPCRQGDQNHTYSSSGQRPAISRRRPMRSQRSSQAYTLRAT